MIFVGVIAYTPANMGAGNWTTAVYIEENANGEQREALGRILSGDVGGPAQRWMPLTTDFNVEGITAGRGNEPMRLENAGHPVSSTLTLARGTASTYTDHGMSWDNTGKNGHYSPFEWQWP